MFREPSWELEQSKVVKAMVGHGGGYPSQRTMYIMAFLSVLPLCAFDIHGYHEATIV